MVNDDKDTFYRETNGFYESQLSDGIERDNIGRPKQKTKPLPVQQPLTENKEKFMERGVPFLKEVKEHPEAKKIAKENGVYVGSPFWHEFLIIFFILVMVGGIAGSVWFFGYGVYNDKFKTDVSVNMTCPEIEIPACPTIEIPECPACESICEVQCPEFPDQLEIFIRNETD